jgi:hypothetical protein
MQEIGRPMTVPTKRQNLQMGCQHEQAVNTMIAIAMLLFPGVIVTRQPRNTDSNGIQTAGPACFNSPLPPDTQFEAIYQILGTSMDKMIHHLGKHALWKNSQLHIGKIETHQIA